MQVISLLTARIPIAVSKTQNGISWLSKDTVDVSLSSNQVNHAKGNGKFTYADDSNANNLTENSDASSSSNLKGKTHLNTTHQKGEL